MSTQILSSRTQKNKSLKSGIWSLESDVLSLEPGVWIFSSLGTKSCPTFEEPKKRLKKFLGFLGTKSNPTFEEPKKNIKHILNFLNIKSSPTFEEPKKVFKHILKRWGTKSSPSFEDSKASCCKLFETT